MLKKLLMPILMLLVLFGMAAGPVDEEDDSGMIGKEVPVFTVPGFDGTEISSGILDGKVAMVVFWFST